MHTITLEDALELFKLPRKLGQQRRAEVSVGIGRFGPFAKRGSTYASLKKEDDPYTIDLARAVFLIEEKEEIARNRIIKAFDGSDIQVLNGRYGPYISDGKLNGSIPKDREPASLTLEEVTKLMEETGKPMRGRFGKKAAAKKEPAVKAPKTVAKKAVAKKAPPRRPRQESDQESRQGDGRQEDGRQDRRKDDRQEGRQESRQESQGLTITGHGSAVSGPPVPTSGVHADCRRYAVAMSQTLPDRGRLRHAERWRGRLPHRGGLGPGLRSVRRERGHAAARDQAAPRRQRPDPGRRAVDQFDGLLDWESLPHERRDEVLASWPGPHTWIVPATPRVPRWITGAHDGVAVRVSAHPTVVALCTAFGGPLVSTSANLSGQPPAQQRAALDPHLLERIDGVCIGETGGLAAPTAIRDARSGTVLRA